MAKRSKVKKLYKELKYFAMPARTHARMQARMQALARARACMRACMHTCARMQLHGRYYAKKLDRVQSRTVGAAKVVSTGQVIVRHWPSHR